MAAVESGLQTQYQSSSLRQRWASIYDPTFGLDRDTYAGSFSNCTHESLSALNNSQGIAHRSYNAHHEYPIMEEIATDDAVALSPVPKPYAFIDPNHKSIYRRTSTSPSVRLYQCINCSGVGTGAGGSHLQLDQNFCRFHGCDSENKHYKYVSHLAKHERSHYGNPGDYRCPEAECYTKAVKFADLKRHVQVTHCTNPLKFPCHVLGCKYGGDNGFARKVKLKSHHRNVHEGKIAPRKANRRIKPKTSGQAAQEEDFSKVHVDEDRAVSEQ